jgi:hypothetical protein
MVFRLEEGAWRAVHRHGDRRQQDEEICEHRSVIKRRRGGSGVRA